MNEHAQPQTEELKKHGDPLETAVEKSVGEISSKEEDQTSEGEQEREKE